MAATLNSSVRVTRKSLADQIDRLDVILDGLSDALNESVADAVRGVVGTAVRQAVQLSIHEVLENPELLRLAMLKHGLATIPLGSQPRLSWGQRLGGLIQRVGETLRQTARSVGQRLQQLGEGALAYLRQAHHGTEVALSAVARSGKVTGRKLTAFARLLWSHPVVTLITLSTGAAGVTLGILGPREVTATLLGLSSSLLALGGSMAARFRFVLGYLPK
ncbi:MAG: hypothetical protein ACKO23_16805, partial [Gemmataceae bacterium]